MSILSSLFAADAPAESNKLVLPASTLDQDSGDDAPAADYAQDESVAAREAPLGPPTNAYLEPQSGETDASAF